MSLPPPQKWCGQSQPHSAHTWVMNSNAFGLYASCAGYNLTTMSWVCRLCGSNNAGTDHCSICNLSRDADNYTEINYSAQAGIETRFQTMADAYTAYMKGRIDAHTKTSDLSRFENIDEQGRPKCGYWSPLLGPCIKDQPHSHEESGEVVDGTLEV